MRLNGTDFSSIFETTTLSTDNSVYTDDDNYTPTSLIYTQFSKQFYKGYKLKFIYKVENMILLVNSTLNIQCKPGIFNQIKDIQIPSVIVIMIKR